MTVEEVLNAMKPRKKLCVFLVTALLLQLLAGCHAADDPENGTPGPDASGKPVNSQKADPSGSPDSSAEITPEPTPEPDLWDPSHRLDIAFTPAKELELPISGATGYATVKLPLWEELPEEEEGKLATIYAPPEPSPEPSEEPDPEPSPTDEPGEPTEEPPDDGEPMPEPAPEETAEQAEPNPQAEEGGTEISETDPLPTETEDGEPAPFISVAPTEEDPPDASPEVPEEPAPEFSEEPSPEPTEEVEPTPTPDPMEEAVLVLEPGAAFTILEESGDWWRVRAEGETGWVEHRYCLINLPDVAPSIIYNATNAYSSAFVSSGKNIPNITGRPLYHGKEMNERLGRREFMMPVLYSMAKNVCQAQQNALAEGNTIVLYEGYRPYKTQMEVVHNLSALARKDDEVRAGISTRPWNISWFIATGSSNHQEGYAMDVSLAKVTQAHVEKIGGHSFVQVDEWEEYRMPTPIHELSMAAATYTQPVAIYSNTAWRSAAMAPAMAANEPAKALQRYCTSAKLTPLASEWWHFNDLAAYSQIRAYHSTGNFEITQCLSTVPG